jgi:hypothetical protein
VFATSSVGVARPERPALLPDTEITRNGSLRAWLIDPTTRYGHAVLGDAIEAGGFAVERDGRLAIHRLPEDSVFEDRRVRLVDVDGDGKPEALVVRARLDRGASLALYRLLPDRIEPLAEGPVIGTRHRWLNPVGVADFAGAGRPLVAAVVTPHLAGSLRLYRLAGDTLAEVARLDGYTNHIIGSRDLDLAAVVPSSRHGGKDIVLPTLDRRHLARIVLEDGALREVRRWPLAGRIERLASGPGNGRVTARQAGGAQVVRIAD